MIDLDEQQRAEHANALLTDPMIVSFFAAMHAAIVSEWVASQDAGQRELLWYRQQAVDDFRAYLHSFIASGALLTHAELRNGRTR